MPDDPNWIKREASEAKRDARRAMAHVDRHERMRSSGEIANCDLDDDSEERITNLEHLVAEERRPRMKITGPFGIHLELSSPTPTMIAGLAIVGAIASGLTWLLWPK